MSTGLDKVDLSAADAVPVEAVPADATQAVKARGYWELVWIRFRRDRLALISVGFIILLLFMAFIGGPRSSRGSSGTAPITSSPTASTPT